MEDHVVLREDRHGSEPKHRTSRWAERAIARGSSVAFGDENTMNKKRKCCSLQKIARVSCIGGGALVLLTIIAFLATAIYETIVPPTDMHLPGLLTAAMMLYVAPIGGILLVFGGLMWIGISYGNRRSGRRCLDLEKGPNDELEEG